MCALAKLFHFCEGGRFPGEARMVRGECQQTPVPTSRADGLTLNIVP